jgi:hypothetical protein
MQWLLTTQPQPTYTAPNGQDNSVLRTAAVVVCQYSRDFFLAAVDFPILAIDFLCQFRLLVYQKNTADS